MGTGLLGSKRVGWSAKSRECLVYDFHLFVSVPTKRSILTQTWNDLGYCKQHQTLWAIFTLCQCVDQLVMFLTEEASQLTRDLGNA